MSVINQMLKDLESRRQSGGDGNVLDGVAWHGDNKAKRSLPLLGLLLLVFAAVIAWLVYERNNDTTVQQAAAQAAVASQPVEVAKASKAVTDPVIVEQPAVVAEPVTPAVPAINENVPAPTSEVIKPAAATEPVDTVVPPQIFSVSPEPVPGTGRQTEIVVRGEGFDASSTVFVSWRDGQRDKQLASQQVNVNNEGLLVLKINPGRNTDNWTVRVENEDGNSSDAYAFRVVAQEQIRVEPTALEPASQVPVVKRARQLSPGEQAANLYSKARTQLSRGRRLQGEESLRRALEINPSLHEARKLLAGLLIRDGRNGEAAALLDSGLEISAAQTDFLLLRARIYTGQGNLAAATALLESQQPALQQAADYYALLAALYQRSNRHRDAVALYSNMLKLNPGQPVWNMGLGISLEATGDTVKARDAYERALKNGLGGDDVRKFVSDRLRALP